MDEITSFGEWLRRRRKALDLTQAELADRAGCVPGTIKSIEADARRPSKQLAERLAECLGLGPDERGLFLKVARAELSADRLTSPTYAMARAVGADAAHPPALAAPQALPTGTVTFLFTDIEGSTRLWEQHAQAMRSALARHDAMLTDAIAAHHGVVVKRTGDGMLAAFAHAPDALVVALAAQRALRAEHWGALGSLQARMALHTGAAEARDGDYYGATLNRAARLLAIGHGGQILLARATVELLHDHLPSSVDLRDLGTHRLKDLSRPEHIFQLVAPDLPADFPALQTLESRPNNLPAQPTALLGREREVTTIGALLRREEVRLLTLTGSGGIGKTRLALQVAVELLDTFTDGVWFVDLAPVHDPNLVITTIAQTLGVKEIGSQPLVEQLSTYLRPKQLLLLLDNFEQVVDAAPRVAELLAAAPQLKILVTSRVMLHLRGEQEYAVPPLALPDPKQLPPLATLSQYAAVALFIERAQDVKLDFQITNENAPAVAEICHRLDGLPLAIELAAARIKLFAPEALLARLERRPGVLTGGPRDVPARQQTIRNTIDWSYQLLDEGEQRLFMWLGVFVVGCTLEAAEAVCNATGDLDIAVLDGLAALVDQSLLRQEEGMGDARFRMLETVREFALEQLREHQEVDILRERHARYYVQLAEQAEEEVRGSRQVIWSQRLDQEHENIRAALTWSLQQDTPEVGLRLVGALYWYWMIYGHVREGYHWCSALLPHLDTVAPELQAKASLGTAVLSWYIGDTEHMVALLEKCVDLSRSSGNARNTALACDLLAVLAAYRGEQETAAEWSRQSIALMVETGDRWGLAAALGSQGIAAFNLLLFDHAETCLTDAVARHRETGDTWSIMYVSTYLGLTLVRQGKYQRAEQVLMDGLRLTQVVGMRFNVPEALVGLAATALAQGLITRAIQLSGAMEALREIFGTFISPAVQSIRVECVARARSHLDEPTFTAAWEAGRAMSLEQTIAYALEE